jgi:dTDP-4-amino-4,6-dideoxygalactose transaminase
MSTIVSIPQANPRANYLAHKDQIDAAIARILDSGVYILGQEVANFEREFAAYIGVGYAIGVGSGTEALNIALRACGIGRGHLVITAAHTAVATVAAIELCGATPLLVDIDPITFTIDPNRVEDTLREFANSKQSAINGRPKAIVPVHLYGHPADIESIVSIAHRYELRVIEDCAQSHGAMYLGRKSGAWGDMAAFSFYPTKNLGALGDGGMIVTSDSELEERARLLREYGWRDRHVSEFPGLNSRLDALQAAILQVKLQFLDQENGKRRILAGIYDNALRGSSVKLPKCCPKVLHVYHQYVVRCPQRDSLRAFLRERAIGTSIHYPVAVHQQFAYRGRVSSTRSLDHSEAAASQVLSLPMYPELPAEHAEAVTEAISSYNKELSG